MSASPPAPRAVARLGAEPEDFRVDEILPYAPRGEGGHTFVHVEKRLRTSDEVARALARFAGARPRDVGYAGRKDRVAVARQWFSVPDLDPARALAFEGPGMRVLSAARHGHKLRTGQVAGNRFRVTLREAAPHAQQVLAGALEVAQRCGVPNRFGGQRFGRDGSNAERGMRLLAGRERERDRRRARFLLSALQAAVFNDVLAERGSTLETVERGDVAVVHASGGLFVVVDPAREAPRAERFEISATGPIFGLRASGRDPRPEGEVAARESRALARRGLRPEVLRPPPGVVLRGARRALRMRPSDTSLAGEAGGLVLGFTLPSGSYATVLLAELGIRTFDPDDMAGSRGVF